MTLYTTASGSGVNKDLTFKAKDKDKDQTLKAKDQDKDQTPKDKDKDKDQTFEAKDQDKDKDCIVKDKDQDKDCILVLKESLRTRTRTTTNITGQWNLVPAQNGFRCIGYLSLRDRLYCAKCITIN